MDGMSRIQPENPKREWLVRCEDGGGDLAVCAITVSRGTIELFGPDDEQTTLSGSHIADYRQALDEAIAQAEHDLSGTPVT
ncbi:hypothetical protein EV193_111150 [Herbihabitans rhizosphaerae]|uniref:Uncharacterized protein n=1 Tax=Herbihabitans rhizosphaerae TaxID=1872711 RepID=A0A4Q7KET3_9PSEU|nr:hypothetical protein [Herbihabitans rhizosphaerae]RZS32765.1 hypothetical protein EV193_111150 [Herbihabitans rhizosphaerae]